MTNRSAHRAYCNVDVRCVHPRAATGARGTGINVTARRQARVMADLGDRVTCHSIRDRKIHVHVLQLTDHSRSVHSVSLRYTALSQSTLSVYVCSSLSRATNHVLPCTYVPNPMFGNGTVIGYTKERTPESVSETNTVGTELGRV